LSINKEKYKVVPKVLTLLKEAKYLKEGKVIWITLYDGTQPDVT
jgi:hypothetical protein